MGTDDGLAPGERIPPGRERPALWVALGPGCTAVAMAFTLAGSHGPTTWLAAILLVAALLTVGAVLVMRWRRAPERLARRRP